MLILKNAIASKLVGFVNVFKKQLYILSAVLLAFFSLVTFAETGLSEYRLGSGDKIQIDVFGQSNLTTEVTLTDAGTISYPFLGELNVSGMTIGELETKITDGLEGDYLLNPKVTVSVANYRSVYIEGEVVRPGSFAFQPGLTVRKVISLASGFTDLASRSKIYVMSEDDPKKKFRKIDLDATVNPGDIITVKESFF